MAAKALVGFAGDIDAAAGGFMLAAVEGWRDVVAVVAFTSGSQ
jgi:hypothetical protein